MESLNLDALAITVVVSLFIPILTGLLTKYNAPAAVKQIVTLVFSSVTALIADGSTTVGGALVTKEDLVLAGISLTVAITSYLGIYKPHALDANLAPNFGLGGSDVGRHRI